MMEKLTTQDLARVLVEQNGMGLREAQQFVTAIFEVIQQGVESDGLVKVKGLGTFKIVGVEARESVNVNTGKRVVINSHSKITFTPDATMKELVNKPFSQFETVVLNDGVEFDDLGDLSDLEPDVDEPELPEDTDAEPELPINPLVTSIEEEKPVSVEETPAPIEEAPEVVEEKLDEPEPEPVVEEHAPVEEEAPAEVVLPVEETTSAVEEVLAEEEKPSEEEVPAEELPVEEESPAEEEAPEEETSLEEEIPTEEEAPVEEATQDEEKPDNHRLLDVEDSDDDSYESRTPWWKWFLVAIASCAIGFIAGFIVGNAQESKEKLSIFSFVEHKIAKGDTIETRAVKEKPVVAKPVVKQPVGAPPAEAQPAEAKPEEVKPEVKPMNVKPVAVPTDESLDFEKYAQMDVRVRTGAYRIVGTDKVVNAREGETLGKISRRHLGPDMECYLEVYNGIKANEPLKVGQEIKIPKLKWKKKRRVDPLESEE